MAQIITNKKDLKQRDMNHKCKVLFMKLQEHGEERKLPCGFNEGGIQKNEMKCD